MEFHSYFFREACGYSCLNKGDINEIRLITYLNKTYEADELLLVRSQI